MPSVKMPRASWEQVLIGMEILLQQGYLVESEYREICDQVYSQEY
jgi:hypothetical protein